MKLDSFHLKYFLYYECEFVFEITIDITTMQDHCGLPHLKS